MAQRPGARRPLRSLGLIAPVTVVAAFTVAVLCSLHGSASPNGREVQPSTVFATSRPRSLHRLTPSSRPVEDRALARRAIFEGIVPSILLDAEEEEGSEQVGVPIQEEEDEDADAEDFAFGAEMSSAGGNGDGGEPVGGNVSVLSVLRNYLFNAYGTTKGQGLMEWEYNASRYKCKAYLRIPAWNQTFSSDIHPSKKDAQKVAVQAAMEHLARTKRHAKNAVMKVMQMMVKRPVSPEDFELTYMEMPDAAGFNCRVRLFPQFHGDVEGGGLPPMAFEAGGRTKSAAAHAASLQALLYLTTKLALPPLRDDLMRALGDDYKSWDSGVRTLRFENAGPDTVWENFQKRFREFGNVTEFKVKGKRRDKKNSLRKGSVTFDSTLATQAALMQLDGALVDDHMIIVRKWGGAAKEAYNKHKAITVRGATPSPKKGKEVKIFYTNVHPTVSPGDMLQIFEKVGPVCGIWYWVDRTTAKSRGKGVVTFPSQEAADHAVAELGRTKIKNKKLQLKPYVAGNVAAAKMQAAAEK